MKYALWNPERGSCQRIPAVISGVQSNGRRPRERAPDEEEGHEAEGRGGEEEKVTNSFRGFLLRLSQRFFTHFQATGAGCGVRAAGHSVAKNLELFPVVHKI